MQFVLIGILMLVSTLQTFYTKRFADAYPFGKKAAPAVFSVVSGALCAIVTYALIGFNFYSTGVTAALGVACAIVLFVFDIFLVQAVLMGPYSVVMVLTLSGNIVVPSLVALFFGDAITIGKAISMAVIICAIYFVSAKKGEQKIQKKRFFFYAISLFVLNGAYGTLFDVQRRIADISEKDEMIIIAFGGAAVLSAIYLLALYKKDFLLYFRQNKKTVVPLLAGSAVRAIGIHAQVLILPLVNVVLMFSVKGAGILLLNVLVSIIFFKEKLSLKNVIGCILAALGIIGMSVF